MKLSDAPNAIKIEEGKGNNEFVVTRHGQFQTPINVINFYGQQECRETKETIERHWKEVLEVSESLIFIGDTNCAVVDVIQFNENISRESINQRTS